jgi:hypothetical protein
VGSPVVTALAIVVSLAGGVGLGFAAYRYEPLLLGAPVETAEVAAPPEPEPAPSASLAPTPSASAPASASAAPPSEEARTCLRSMFPEDSFSDANVASVDFVCSETSGLKAAEGIKKALVNAGSAKASGGMKEWSVLGFYSLAAASVIRGRCCPNAPPLTMPASPKPCESIEEAMTSLGTIAQKRGKKTEAITALGGFEKSVRCILKTQSQKSFGDYPELKGGEATTFEKTLSRALK